MVAFHSKPARPAGVSESRITVSVSAIPSRTHVRNKYTALSGVSPSRGYVPGIFQFVHVYTVHLQTEYLGLQAK